MPNVFSPRDLVSRPDNMDETVPHTHTNIDVSSDNFFTSRHFPAVYFHFLFSVESSGHDQIPYNCVIVCVGQFIYIVNCATKHTIS